jgi:hypothetical protein
MRALSRSLFAFSVLTLALASCASVIGIEDAELDPLLGGAGAAPPAIDCASYCNEIQATCQGALQQYDTLDSCLGFCAALPLGNPGDTEVNSIACRHAELEAAVAINEPEVHCASAGPGGENVPAGADDACGGACEAYCTVLRATCASDFATVFSDHATCLADCDLLIDDGVFDASKQSGDTLQCRLWHLSAATVVDTPHCLHALGDDPCI